MRRKRRKKEGKEGGGGGGGGGWNGVPRIILCILIMKKYYITAALVRFLRIILKLVVTSSIRSENTGMPSPVETPRSQRSQSML